MNSGNNIKDEVEKMKEARELAQEGATGAKNKASKN